MTASSQPRWEGARNLADLGGLALRDGGQTQHGVVFRSAAPEWLTTAGWAAARAAGLRRIVDLRNAMERDRRAEHPQVAADATAGVEIVHAPTEDPDDPAFLARCGPWLDHPRSWAPTMELYPERFARVFTALVETSGPVLIHCAGGRDRTGMICSILLACAEADTDAICDNYEAGFRGAAAHRGHGWAYDPTAGRWTTGADAGRSADELDAAIADRLPTLRDWLATTDVRGYLREAGLTQDHLDRLRVLLR